MFGHTCISWTDNFRKQLDVRFPSGRFSKYFLLVLVSHTMNRICCV